MEPTYNAKAVEVPMVEGPVNQELVELTRSISRAFDYLGDLENRISGILAPPSPNVVPSDCNPSAGTSFVTCELHNLVERVDALCGRISELKYRAEV